MGELFGTDGIRGSVGTWPVITDYFYKIGFASGLILSEGNEKTRILVGRDTRESGINLQESLVSGMISSGVDVIDLGVITTPAVSMLIKNQNLSAGAVISASQTVKKGVSLEKSIEEYKDLFPLIVVQMIQVGETSGALDALLKHFANFYEAEISAYLYNKFSVDHSVYGNSRQEPDHR